MIDLRLLRDSKEEGGNIEIVKHWQRLRKLDTEVVDQVSSLDADRRRILKELNLCRCQKGSIKSRSESSTIDIEALKDRISSLEKVLGAVQSDLDVKLSCIGNFVDEDADKFLDIDFNNSSNEKPKKLPIIDPLWCIGGYEIYDSSNKASLSGVGVLIARGLVDYAIYLLSEKENHTKIYPPSQMVSTDCLNILGRRKSGNSYDLAVSQSTLMTIPTQLGTSLLHRGKFIPERSLPYKFCAIASDSQYLINSLNRERNCLDEQVNRSNLIRCSFNTRKKQKKGTVELPSFAHPTDNVESIIFCSSDLDTSRKVQNGLLNLALNFYRSLNISCRVVKVPFDTLLPCESSCFLIEGYIPMSDAYLTIGHVGNYLDYVSRDLKIRCGTKKIDNIEKYFVHTSSLSLCRIENLLPAVIECNASDEGFAIPTALLPFISEVYNYTTMVPYIRKRSRGKGGKILITEEKQFLKDKSAKARKGYQENKVLFLPKIYIPINTTVEPNTCFGDLFTIENPTTEDICSELTCSEFPFPLPSR